MTGPDRWAEVEDGVAEFDDLLHQMGASGELRAELSDRLREVALLPAGDPGKELGVLAMSVQVLPFLEAELRAFGHETLADEIARFTVGLALWLEMPAGLAVFVGAPQFQE